MAVQCFAGNCARGMRLELSAEAKKRIQNCRDYLDKRIAESKDPLYGITTGFGSLCDKNISLDELGTLQENLIKSHDPQFLFFRNIVPQFK